MDNQIEKSERDINDIFDDIALVEQKYSECGYREGYRIGSGRANYQGYWSGYQQGKRVGNELAEIYGTIVAIEQSNIDKHIGRLLLEIRKDVIQFPTTNVDNIDIIGALTKLRSKYKRLRCLLNLPEVSSDSGPVSSSNLKDSLTF